MYSIIQFAFNDYSPTLLQDVPVPSAADSTLISALTLFLSLPVFDTSLRISSSASRFCPSCLSTMLVVGKATAFLPAHSLSTPAPNTGLMGEGVSCIPLSLVTVATVRPLDERAPLPVAVQGLCAVSLLSFPEGCAAGLVILVVLFLFFLFLPAELAAGLALCFRPFPSAWHKRPLVQDV